MHSPSRIEKRKKGPDARCSPWTATRRRTTRTLERKLAKDGVDYTDGLRTVTTLLPTSCCRTMTSSSSPSSDVSRLVQRRNWNIRSATVRKMYTWSHYKYRQRLQWAAMRYPGRHVIESLEPETSRTCTDCGFWHADLKVSQKMRCRPRCGVEVDRDVAGARNNFFSEHGRAVGIGWGCEDGAHPEIWRD